MTTIHTAPALTADRLRTVLGHFATGVTIVTAHGGDGPIGMAANSFTSVSLDPPLILLCPGRSSSTWPAIRDAGRFCINIMGRENAAVTKRFSQKGLDRFADIGWIDRPTGPALESAMAWVECAVRDEHDAGDHTIVVADVLDVGVSEVVDPLVFFRGKYGTFDASQEK
ncbi:flavin reductase [Rhodococcus sp. 05-2256-B2]|uniref:flavin reductase family protein n=1 Tax=Nocardiaceae TaxID=85025 RepID=UPI00050C2B1E|nr:MULTISPECIES: flavin reductase family protein [Rhodococcus]OZD86897.1 flavin reductase [Rhodococcus sp. 05-2256-B4]OZD87343.1 flavin reductase [Rhodococcus sp. 05-2256-B3]OZD94871.1 flavin reductase [Rhodococcus sp. 05-2256-B2]OZE07877.1 flavin reductase [Rhodococcus sp. 05-2256-B1]